MIDFEDKWMRHIAEQIQLEVDKEILHRLKTQTFREEYKQNKNFSELSLETFVDEL